MNSVLSSALEAIRAERGAKFSRAFNEAQRVLVEFGEPDIANRLLRESTLAVPAEDLADLLGILIWSGSDNGSGIARDVEQWLRHGTDERRLWIALSLDHYPFRDRSEMELVLARIAKNHPSLAARCGQLVESRRNLHET